MARDRKRAKQRQQRRAQRGASLPARSEPVRADVPGALQHASGDVDEFDAALLRGARGVPADPELGDVVEVDEGKGSNGAVADSERAEAGGHDGESRAAAREALAPAVRAEATGAEVAHEHRQPLPRRAVGFLRASWAELQRVQWPDRSQVFQATAVVLGFVAVAGVYLGAADWVAQKIVNFIL